MVTLTYRENMLDRELALKHWKAFYQKLGKHKQFHYVAVIEEQARGCFAFSCGGRWTANVCATARHPGARPER
jgi:hypothetical protein